MVSGGAIDADPDCEFDTATGGFKACAKSADASVTIDTPPGFVLQKSVSKEEIEPGEAFHYDIAFYAMGQTLRQIDIPDVIGPNAHVVVTKEMVDERLSKLVQNRDLSQFIL